MRNFKKSWLGLSLMALGAGLGAQSAVAAEAVVSDEIVVTTQKRAQAINDVPIALSAFTGETLARIGVTKLDELALFTPGLEIQEQSPNNPGFAIRGITSDDGAGFQEQRVAVFQDGVPISRARGAYVGLFDVERIEVAKGPQATLFGRGALVGALNLIRNKPNLEVFSGDFGALVGDYDQLRLEGAVNAPIVAGKLGVRFAALKHERDGVVNNGLDTRGLGGIGVDAQRLTVGFAPTSDLRFDLAIDRQVDDWPGTSFKSRTFAALRGDASPFTDATLNVSSPFIEGGKRLGIKREINSATLTSTWEATEALTGTAIASYREFDSTEVFDPDGSSLPLLLVAEQATGQQSYYEARLRYDAGGPISAFGGVSYFSEEATQRVPLAINVTGLALLAQGALFPFASNLSTLPPTLAGAIAADAISVNQFTNSGETESVDVFGDVTWRATQRLELTAGVRYSQDDKTSGILGQVSRGIGLFAQTTSPTAARTRSGSFDGTTWRAVARYELSDDVNVFASYARGRRPDVISASAATAVPSFTAVPAEEVDSYEVGVKGDALDGALGFDASVFYMAYKNFQSTRFNASGGIETFNAGEATAPGFEGQINWRPIAQVNLIGSYAYNGFEFDTGARKGNRARLSPEHSASVFADIGFPVGEVGAIYVRPSYTWQSEVFFDDDNDRAIFQLRPQAALGGNFNDRAVDEVQKAYGLANLRVGFEDAEGRFSIGAFVTNALDEEYVIDAGNTGDIFGIPTFIRGAPRLFGAEIKARF